MDRDFAEMFEEYAPVYGKPFFSEQPQLMQTLAVEETISASQEALPFEKISTIIEGGQSFMVNDCICKKEKGLMDTPCDRTVSVCLGVAPIPNAFDKSPIGRVISKQEAYDLMKKSEEEGLVHLTANIQFGHIYICNCCKCCCGVLRAINQFGIPAPLVVNSYYYAVIDQYTCIGCGICASERCQVNAIDELENTYKIAPERCIGCGLCVSHCPVDAVRMQHKESEKLNPPPITEDEWFAARSRFRGVDYSAYK
jgi:NAD-dependent dihydropyrimidine dehydrogenase PreA subunit